MYSRCFTSSAKHPSFTTKSITHRCATARLLSPPFSSACFCRRKHMLGSTLCCPRNSFESLELSHTGPVFSTKSSTIGSPLRYRSGSVCRTCRRTRRPRSDRVCGVSSPSLPSCAWLQKRRQILAALLLQRQFHSDVRALHHLQRSHTLPLRTR